MKVKDSKNLTYSECPTVPDGADIPCAPAKAILKSFDFFDTKIVFYFENRYWATIRAKNLEGQRELALLAKKLNDFIGKSYQEILNIDL